MIKEDEVRPFDAKAIAKHLVEGDTVRLGENIWIYRHEGVFCHVCTRCNATQAFTLDEVLARSKEIALFVMEHRHRERS